MANKQPADLERPSLLYCCTILFITITLFLCAFIPPPLPGPLVPVNSFYLSILRSRRNVQITILAAIIFHVFEGAYAWYLARSMGSRHAIGWFLQTFVFGGGSLIILMGMRGDKKD